MQDKSEPEPGADEFRDPLANYDPKEYQDPLERALAEEAVAAIESRPYASVSPSEKVRDVIKKLVDLDVGCVLVEDQGNLVGVFTERDSLNKVALEYQEAKDRPISEFMTPNPICVYDTDKSAAALSVMAASGYRHVPVIDLNQKVVGVVGPQRVTSFLQTYFEEIEACEGCVRQGGCKV